MRLFSLVVMLALALGACAADPAEPPTDAPHDCAAGELRCGGACVDPLRDPAHCGGCGEGCDAGEVCSAGACASTCGEGEIACGGSCTDVSDDAANCGACGNACGEGRVCDDGACACAAGTELCGDACVNTATDAANCGACGTTCEAGESCVDGGCALACEQGRAACGDVCVDTDTDDANCGGCGQACEGETSCVEGACVCPGGTTACGDACVNTDTDLANCGGCGNVCPVDENASAAVCVDGACAPVCADGWTDCDGDPANGCEARLDDDVAHCGACGNACGEGAYCASGVCCGEGGLVCGGACVDPLEDAANCGGCGLGCAGFPASSGGVCAEGGCVLACVSGTGDCNAVRDDGCETDVTADRQNCGGCGISCGALCGEGACLGVTLPPKIFHHTCVLLGDGSVFCWGFNQYAQLGDHTTANATTPVRALVPPASALAVGEYHNCAIVADGGVTCWGRNDRGQLGNGTNVSTLQPQTVMDGAVALSGVTQLALTELSTCALLADGGVKCWGAGQHGRLGNGVTDDALVPVAVTDGTAPIGGVTEIAAGIAHVCARSNDGSVRCWGRNNNGQLGLGEGATDSSVAAPVPGLTGVDQLVAAGFRSCARIGGTAKCWGQNLSGQAGDGTTLNNRLSPVDVQGLSTAARLHIAPNHGCALVADGTARCWGLNNLGQLGDGTTTSQPLPTTVVEPGGTLPWTGLAGIAAGGAHTCAVQADQTVLCWGYNQYGQIGDGGTTTVPEPVEVVW